MLKLGDLVEYVSDHGNGSVIQAKVKFIECCPIGSDEGMMLPNAPLDLIRGGLKGKHFIICFDNGKWAYGAHLVDKVYNLMGNA